MEKYGYKKLPSLLENTNGNMLVELIKKLKHFIEEDNHGFNDE